MITSLSSQYIGPQVASLRRRGWPRDGSLALAIASLVSIVSHLAVFLIARPQPNEFVRPSLLPDLRLWIEQPGDAQVERDEIASVRPATAPRSALDAAPLPAVAAVSTTVRESEIAESDARQQTIAKSSEESHRDAAEAPVSSEQQAGELVTTTGTSDWSTVATATAAVATPSPAATAMLDPERAMLQRRIQAWAKAFHGSAVSQTRLSWRERGRNYTAAVQRESAANNMDLDKIIVTITTDDQGQRLTSRMQMKRLAFSHFTQLVDQWDTTVQLHDDEVAGRFHSNSEIMVGWDRKTTPKFWGQVTTAARRYTVASESSFRSRNEIFRGGLELGAQRIALPRNFLAVAGDARDGDVRVRRFQQDTDIEFLANGGFHWRTAATNGSEERAAPSGQGLHLLAAPGMVLRVKGVVRGKVLVYSPEQIVITGNLTYAGDPRTTADSSDFLGLVSDRDIDIAAPDVTGPGDLAIHAALYARRRFVVRNEQRGGHATLSIYGSLSAGSISATEPRYATRIEFDRRFERLRPPDFPMTDRYELDAWDGQWTRE